MAIIYPQTPTPSIPLTVEQIFKTLISSTESGKEYRRTKWIKPKRRIKIKYNRRYKNELENIWQFHFDRKGNYESFIFIFPYSENWNNEYVGKGDGTTATFKLPVWNDYTSLSIYINGTLQTEGTDYTITTYTDDRPDVVFTTAPAQGDIITCDFSGKPALIMRFEEYILNKEMIENLLTTIGLTLVEVK